MIFPRATGPRTLFTGVTLGIDERERIALIGANGSGKSTLLKILASLEEPDDGSLEARRDLVVGYVPQEEAFDARPAVDIVATFVDAADKRRLAATVLGRVGFDDIEQPADKLSGGWRKRLSLACQLAREPDVLLMDEPTNHLDLEGVLWLEGLVKSGRFAVLVVSHDRRFLDGVATRTVELSAAYPDGFLSHDGNYTQFVDKRDAYLVAQKAREQSLASGVRRENEWLARGAKARTTKAKGRIERAGEMTAELADLRKRNADRGAAAIGFGASNRKTNKLVQLEGVAKSLGGKALFKDVDITLSPGSTLGLIGPNGSGKSTLIRLLVGDLEPDAGTVTRAGGLNAVVFDQHRAELDPELPLRRALFPNGDNQSIHGKDVHIVGWAQKFLFRPDQLDLPVSQLSGGERARVLLAGLLLEETDLLILDEPTNDLDIPTLDVLEQALVDFPGAVVLVTHDRHLLERASDTLLALDGRGNATGFASLQQWERARTASLKAAAEAKKPATPQARRQDEKPAHAWREARTAEDRADHPRRRGQGRTTRSRHQRPDRHGRPREAHAGVRAARRSPGPRRRALRPLGRSGKAQVADGPRQLLNREGRPATTLGRAALRRPNSPSI